MIELFRLFIIYEDYIYRFDLYDYFYVEFKVKSYDILLCFLILIIFVY